MDFSPQAARAAEVYDAFGAMLKRILTPAEAAEFLRQMDAHRAAIETEKSSFGDRFTG